ncbi:DUF397 domain-containing protein [Actinomadura citrea]|jgi:hypothetical protein|uniref:DUF397 domain-containing protein n=1 Tax=Actinomadura citrea TaxID=46158 RepID=A0A7Y9GH70_9ACTN|nr:DUF397 domain-containing protein [Actinomadura citrea]NYE15260.1 hypothetical protein [Actinomadura citrea]GGT94534.1 DUF397 domain-containing protein [Actinomadura citrea]
MTSAWRKSSYSGGATDEACVEMAALPDGVGVRDSKDPEGGRLTVSGDVFGGLLQRIKEGALDLA